MGKSPFIDAIEALEEIRDFCKRRQKSYEGWEPTPDSTRVDLKSIREKAERAIKDLKPNFPAQKVKENKERSGDVNCYKGVFE